MFFSKPELSRRTEQARPILEQLRSAGCRFMQIEMPDNNGRLRGKILPLAKGLSALGTGASTNMLTINGGDDMCFTSPFSCYENGFPKMSAVPDLTTAVVLPWKHDVAAVLSDCYMDDGSPCPVDGRQVLKKAERALAELGYSAKVALEFEVYILQADDALIRQGRYTELNSFGRGWDAYSLSKSPSFEGLAKEFMTRCEAAGIPIEAFHSEYGHGMFEYTFIPQTPLKAADDSARAKLYLKQLCAEQGLVACYMAAMISGTGDSFSGCHHNFSLARGDDNAFWDESTQSLSQVARHAAAGILETMSSSNIIYRPWVNSFRRMNRFSWNPENASWGKENHTCAIRVAHGPVPEKLTRFEHRAPGADINPYLSVASLLIGSIFGIREKKEPPPYATGDAMLDKRWPLLPRTMLSAIESLEKSSILRDGLGSQLVDQMVWLKKEEWLAFTKAVPSPDSALQGKVTDWELTRYFEHA